MICPWEIFANAHQITCEAQLCSWVRQPANALSNLSIFIAIFFILKKSRTSFAKTFALLLAFVGVSSTMAHASLIHFFGSLDFLSQFILLTLIITTGLWRTGYKKMAGLVFVAWLIFSISGFFSVIGMPYSLYFYSIFLSSCVVIEAYFYVCERKNRGRGGVKFKNLLICMSLFTLGLVFFFLDFLKIFCDPNNHWFQLHSLWHIFAAIASYFLFLHLEQFYNEKPTGSELR